MIAKVCLLHQISYSLYSKVLLLKVSNIASATPQGKTVTPESLFFIHKSIVVFVGILDVFFVSFIL
tara:strand:- start:657 stop:854 length:198 start_codon:yes stop_codon:yes gene_type:complete